MSDYSRLNLKNGDVVDETVFKHIEDSLVECSNVAKEIDGTPGMNFTDLSGFEPFQGYIMSTGKWGNFNENYMSVVIPITGGYADLDMKANGTLAIYFSGLKSFKTPVLNESVEFSDDPEWNTRKSISKTGRIIVTLPTDVKYLVISVLNGGKDCSPSFFTLKSNDGGGKVGYLSERVDKLEKIGVRYIALGDSITQGYYSKEGDFEDGETMSAGDNMYVRVLSRLKGYDLTNKGVGGSGWLKRGTTQSPKLNAREQIDATNEDGSYVLDFTQFDLCTIAWGVNDWKGSENLGSFEDGLNPEVESVYANIRYCLETIQRRNPNMKIIVISPVNCRIGVGSSEEGNYGIGFQFNGKTLDDFSNAIKECCEYYCIEYVDMLHRGPINRLNAVELLPDKVHPSMEAHILMGYELAGKIQFGK